MLRMSMRVVAIAALVGLALQTFSADAGWRRFRYFGTGCAAPSCAIPSCSAPLFVAAPSPSFACSGPACSGPSCFGPSCYQPTCGGWGGCASPLGGIGASYYGGSPYGMSIGAGYAPSVGYLPQPPNAPIVAGTAYPTGGFSSGIQTPGGLYGAFGSAGYPQSFGYGDSGINSGIGSSVPSYYAPVTSQYTPVPPAPASDLVW